MPSTVETVEKHVPAWKKLGLKLKNARDKPVIVCVNVGEAVPEENKRKLHIKDYAEQNTAPPLSARPSKKSKKSVSDSNKSTVTAAQNPSSPSSAPQKKGTSPSALQKEPPRKNKSVSFAPQAKTEDADSAKDLYNTWLTSQLASDPSFDPSKTGSPALKSITPTSVSDPTATVTTSNQHPKKKRKKSKSTALSQPLKAPSKPAPVEASSANRAILDYLQTYYTARAHWKFSKTRQTQLLRSFIPRPQKPSLIPPSHLPALHAYLSGLQGPSARSRLRAQALTVREEDEKWLNEDMEVVETKERRKAEYLREVERVKELLKGVEDDREEREKVGSKQFWERVQKRRVAEVVLWSVGEQGKPEEEKEKGKGRNEEEITSSGARIVEGGAGVKRPLGKNGKPKRKRKRRTTGVPDDEISSSSSSSSSDDDEDSDKEEKMVATKPTTTAGDIETSSSKSSSGSDSESSDGGGSSGSSGSESGSGSGSGSESGSDGQGGFLR